MKVGESTLDSGMPLDRNADVEVLRHDQGRGRSRPRNDDIQVLIRARRVRQ